MPIWRDANAFLLAIEKVVKTFPRYHKYTLGTELRKNALTLCNLIHQAWHEKTQTCQLLKKFKYCIDEIKIQLHLAKKLEAYPSFSTFEFLSLQAVMLGHVRLVRSGQ
uniref:four helix bundle protein n=1 Tax=Thiomicrospira microaerophila TaxID=406020 RepID=UPI0009FD637E|nr:four helix bundle protein [Thiomicrospira microaerophila]